MGLININLKNHEFYYNKFNYYFDIVFKYDPGKTEKEYLKEYKKQVEKFLNIKLPNYSRHVIFNTEIKNDQIKFNIKTIF